MIQLFYNGELMYDTRYPDLVCYDVTASLEANTAGTLKFSIPPTNPLYKELRPFSTDAEVVMVEDGSEVFRGRITKPNQDMKAVYAVECEGQLAYLADSIVSPYGTYADAPDSDGKLKWVNIAPSTLRDYAEWLIKQANDQVGYSQRFKVGINQLPACNIVRSSTQTPTTISELKEKVLKPFSAYVKTYMLDGTRMIDFLVNASTTEQRIEFGINLLDYAKSTDYTKIKTVIIPEASGDNAKKVDVQSYPDGLVAGHPECFKRGDRVISQTGAAKFGMIVDHRSYDDATTAGVIGACCNDLEDSTSVVDSLTVKAVDLSKIDNSIESIELLDSVRVTSKPNNFDKYMRCLKRTISDDPTKDEYTLGATLPTIYSESINAEKDTREIASQAVEAVAPLSVEVKAAAKAANTKRRVFTSEPTPPYDVGDLWTDGTNIYVCKTAKEA
ncbi:MAG: phage tail protein [Eggerthellaceae bacterium]|jgi:hypothetical protein|nr:phage tail protein [Eggerthellaceae bacterium]